MAAVVLCSDLPQKHPFPTVLWAVAPPTKNVCGEDSFLGAAEVSKYVSPRIASLARCLAANRRESAEVSTCFCETAAERVALEVKTFEMVSTFAIKEGTQVAGLFMQGVEASL